MGSLGEGWGRRMRLKMTIFDKNDEDISCLVSLANEKASPWHSTGIIVYEHPILGNLNIGYFSSGSITMEEGYRYKLRQEGEK